MNAFAQLSLPGIVVTCALGALLMCLLVLRYGLATPHAHEDESRAPALPLTLHLGHAAAVVCFTVAAVLAVVALARSQRGPLPSAPSPAGGGADTARLTAEVKTLQQRLAEAESRVGAADRRVQGVETRVGAAEGKVAALDASVGQASAAAGQALKAVKQLERAAATEAPRQTSPATVRRSAVSGEPPRPVLPPRPRTTSAEPAPAQAAPSPDPAASPPSAPPPSPQPPSVEPAAPPAPPSLPQAGTPPAISRPPEPPPLAIRTASPPTTEHTRPSPKSAPSGTGEVDLATQVQEDWKGIKRDMKAAGDDIRDTWRRFLHWITP
jgi:hypothetical protein